MTARVAVNGFGRIGRGVVRAALARPGLIEVVAVNDTNDAEMLTYLLQHDTVHGALHAPVALDGDTVQVDTTAFSLSHEPDPTELPWEALGVDIVVESTGRFTMAHEAAGHLKAGAARVIISAPATGADLTVCMGVNHERFDPAVHHIVSNASCTTNCLASMAHVLHDRFELLGGFMST
ncbi:MAG: type I glyceraldehyde-3-phosphate dehydrogenase, partial [Actinomycetota bacterium]|nr:type I glyceraldehyde-3-phosphate dehydrogenase [Actinomycetota bacterium]